MEQVAIVGAGPTGLALGAELRRLGIDSVILDKLKEGQNTSRAAVIHARTLEVLEPLEVTPALLNEGIVVPIFRIRDRDRILASVDFSALDTRYPYTLMCPQDRTEAVLLSRLRAFGGEVRRPVEVRMLETSPSAATLTVQTAEALERFDASFVVGCDGMHSVVREAAGIPFVGGAYVEDFVLADVEMDWPFDRNEVDLFFSEEGLVVVAPLPRNRYRIVATMANAPEELTTEIFEKILHDRGPSAASIGISRMWWSSRFRIQHRVAEKLRKGRVLLAGDAAHVHSPAGGQGMNTGIQDAMSLANALAEYLKSGDEAVLDDWAEKRLSVAKDVVELTDRATRVATLSSTTARSIRNAFISIVGHVPAVQHALAERLAEIKYQ